MLGVAVRRMAFPFANGATTQTARQGSARRVGTRNGPYLPRCRLASYIKYDLRSLTPNLSHFRANAIPVDLFRGSLDCPLIGSAKKKASANDRGLFYWYFQVWLFRQLRANAFDAFSIDIKIPDTEARFRAHMYHLRT